MEICLQEVQKHIPQIFRYSGHYIMRVGNYQDCIDSPGMDYYSVYLNGVGNVIAAIYTNLCLPEQCTVQFVQKAIDLGLETMGVDLKVAYINNKIPQKQQPFTWVFFLTITIITLLLLLVLVSTFKNTQKIKILSAFRIQNSIKIFNYNPKSKLNVLNGIRAFCMFWVIIGHQYSLIIADSSNLLTIDSKLQTWFILFIEAGVLAVDSFFFIGGFLVSYSILKEVKIKSRLRYFLAIINRYLRLIPAYFITILIYYSILEHLVSGPFWFQNTPSIQNCKKMWKPLLFVDNLVDNGNSMCMGWGWYLQNDMQIFVFSVFILFLYGVSRFWSFMFTFISVCISLAYTMQQTYDHKYLYTTHITDFVAEYANYMSDLYIKPWSRCPPYLFGLLFGIFYVQFLVSEKQQQICHKRLNQNRIDFDNTEETDQSQTQPQKHFLVIFKQYLLQNPWKRRIFEMFGIVICIFIILIPRTAQGQNRHWPQFVHSIFLTYSKLLFVIGIMIFTLPSLLGINGLIRFTLDTKAFNFIAKISYCTYLIHLIIMYRWLTSIKIDFYYAYVPLFVLFVATTVQSMIAGFIMCIAVEIPFAKLQKDLMNFILNKKSNKHEGLNKKNKKQIDVKTGDDSCKIINQKITEIKQ